MPELGTVVMAYDEMGRPLFGWIVPDATEEGLEVAGLDGRFYTYSAAAWAFVATPYETARAYCHRRPHPFVAGLFMFVGIVFPLLLGVAMVASVVGLVVYR